MIYYICLFIKAMQQHTVYAVVACPMTVKQIKIILYFRFFVVALIVLTINFKYTVKSKTFLIMKNMINQVDAKF